MAGSSIFRAKEVITGHILFNFPSSLQGGEPVFRSGNGKFEIPPFLLNFLRGEVL